MNETDANPNRRSFLTLAATTAAAGIGAVLPVAGSATAATPSTDHTKWLDGFDAKHKQVTDWPDLNNGMGLGYTFSFLLTAPVGYGVAPSDVGAVLVIRHDTIPIALRDPVWAKYSLGEMFRITDPETKAPAVRNPFYLKPGALPFPDAALQKLMERGVRVAACNLAITFWSSVVAQKMGKKHEEVMQDWLDAVYPGIAVVPSGVFACNAATSRGCQYLFAG